MARAAAEAHRNCLRPLAMPTPKYNQILDVADSTFHGASMARAHCTDDYLQPGVPITLAVRSRERRHIVEVSMVASEGSVRWRPGAAGSQVTDWIAVIGTQVDHVLIWLGGCVGRTSNVLQHSRLRGRGRRRGRSGRRLYLDLFWGS